ncbi:MAG: hypothetical protein WBP59_11635 [Ilumatobacteraceae bacterium]
MTAPAGVLTIQIDDRSVSMTVSGGATTEFPIGPLALIEGPLGTADPPAPADLTNALGYVHDHVDDLLIAAQSIAAAPFVIIAGDHALAMARVEVGADTVPDDYELTRADADEVFRTLATERLDDRRCNPGLDEGHVTSIVATCCVILGIMRRLDLQEVRVASSGSLSDRGGT